MFSLVNESLRLFEGFFLYFWVMSCDRINLGAFDSCEPVVIDEIESPTVITYIQTNRTCEYEDSELGLLEVGEYVFETEEESYYFEVI